MDRDKDLIDKLYAAASELAESVRFHAKAKSPNVKDFANALAVTVDKLSSLKENADAPG